jgi:hypothetical protein
MKAQPKTTGIEKVLDSLFGAMRFQYFYLTPKSQSEWFTEKARNRDVFFVVNGRIETSVSAKPNWPSDLSDAFEFYREKSRKCKVWVVVIKPSPKKTR